MIINNQLGDFLAVVLIPISLSPLILLRLTSPVRYLCHNFQMSKLQNKREGNNEDHKVTIVV